MKLVRYNMNGLHLARHQSLFAGLLIFFVLQQASAQQTARPARLFDLDDQDQLQRVPVGRSVKFKCSVENIGDHKLAWFHKEKRLLLALGNKTVAWKERIRVSSQAESVFFLQIDSIQLSDKVSCCLCAYKITPVT